MSGIDRIVLTHPVLVHLPIAVAVLMPLALIAAQRPGRGIKPWWVTCRYLAWAGVLGIFSAAVSGLIAARNQGLLPGNGFVAPHGVGVTALFRLHQTCAAGSIVLGLLCVRALFRRREEHQGIGVLGLFLGFCWAASTLAAGFYGSQLGRPAAPSQAKVEAPAPVLPAPPPVEPESQAPFKALDYQKLTPMHLEPVKSPPHGNRWIRVWADSGAAEAYRNGRPLPVGSLVVMSTLEDRWGRPGFESGPLYALEIKPEGRTALTFYWPRVPEAHRNETGGADRAYWRDGDANLQGCLSCHGSGIAPQKDRSRWVVPKKPKAEAPAPAE